MGCNKNETKRKGDEIYLDELTGHAAYGLLRTRGISTITVLEAIKSGQELWRWLLNRNGIHVVEAHFFAGHLRTADGESVYLAARSLSRQIALRAARKIVQSEKLLHSLNEKYKRNTILLFVAKQLGLPIEYWTKRVLVAQALAESGHVTIWLTKPLIFDDELLSEVFPSSDLRFYPTAGFSSIKLVKTWLRHVARDIKFTTRGLAQHTGRLDLATPPKPSVLTLQEDSLRADRSLRGQPHWLNVNDPVETFDTYVVALGGPSLPIAEDASQLSKTGVTILPTGVFRFAAHLMRNDKTLLGVSRDRCVAIWTAIHVRGFAEQYFLLQVAFLLRQAQLMGALALCLNARVFLIRETYYSLADAMQLVAPDLNITTVAYQYSNLGVASPNMMSTADKYLIFSEMYKVLYQADGITPKTFLSTGYLYDGVASLVREKALKHREILTRFGARFIVCYLDESVQHDRWGLVSIDDHLGELHALARAVLANPEFGLVVKSQFSRNTPSKLYPTDELIRAAMSTGRYLELTDGAHRNDIYPTEAALVADLCIGHKFGATAALEAAIAGVRTVLLDAYGTKTLWDAVYAQADVEYKTMESLLDAIVCYRSGEAGHQALGDWSAILHHFDPYHDGLAIPRLRNVIEQIVVA